MIDGELAEAFQNCVIYYYYEHTMHAYNYSLLQTQTQRGTIGVIDVPNDLPLHHLNKVISTWR